MWEAASKERGDRRRNDIPGIISGTQQNMLRTVTEVERYQKYKTLCYEKVYYTMSMRASLLMVFCVAGQMSGLTMFIKNIYNHKERKRGFYYD